MDQDEETRWAPSKSLRTEYEEARSTSQLSQQDKEWYIERGKLLAGCYRRVVVNDPMTYAQALTLVLSKYPRSIVEWATDPRTGIQSQEKFLAFPPNAGELKAFCDAEVERIVRSQKPAFNPKSQNRPYVPPANFAGCRANGHVFATAAATYEAAVAWARAPDRDRRDWRWDENGEGIWVNWFMFTGGGNALRAAGPKAAFADAGRQSCANTFIAAGLEPPTWGDGEQPVTLAMMQKRGWIIGNHEGRRVLLSPPSRP